MIVKRRMNSLNTRRSLWPLSVHTCSALHVLRLSVFFCLVGIYFNLRQLLFFSASSRLVSEGYLMGLPEDMARSLTMVGAGRNATKVEEEAKSSFSSCLVFMDDNHWLIEWIAYHYHVLPLRHLVLVVDPRSHTSPTRVLDRWRDKIVIEEWIDEDFLPDWVQRRAGMANVSHLWLHLNRQNFFYAQCLKSLHQRGRAWVTLTDTDEFIRVNPYRHRASPNFRKQPGHILHLLNKLDAQSSNQSCLLAPRIQVSSIERPRPTRGSREKASSVPNVFNTSHFLTLRFLYHNEKEMDAGKNVINLKKTSLSTLPEKRTESVHHALESCPDNSRDRLRADGSHLQIQHYLGTLEQFTYRDDPRDHLHDRRMTWYTRGRSPEPTKKDTIMEPWLVGFIEKEGLGEATELLKDVGRLEPRTDQDSLKRDLPLPPPPPANFSACLILKDDNHWLIEWMAYHYHVLPLRDMIVMVDPTSRSSPQPIFHRWEERINVETWPDEAVIPKHIFRKFSEGNITASGLHRQRQQFFYGQCLRALHRRNATWVLMTDTDEFVVPNPYYASESHKVAHSLRKSGVVRRILQLRIKSRKTKDRTFAPACLLLPRFQMTSQSPKDLSIIQKGVPWGFSGKDFLTTRWLFHNGREINTGHNLDGKNIINLENLKLDQIPSKVNNVHFVLPDACPASDGRRFNHTDTWVWIYHYLGSLEQFTFREDPRDNIPRREKRNATLWNMSGRKGGDGVLRDDAIAIRAWLVGFIESVGWFEARRLLKGVGQTRNPSLWNEVFS